MRSIIKVAQVWCMISEWLNTGVYGTLTTLNIQEIIVEISATVTTNITVTMVVTWTKTIITITI